MDFIEIDKDKCNQDGLCVTVCPSRLFEYHKETPPTTVKDIEGMCIRCGHCVAVCPTGALRHRSLDIHKFEEVKEEFRLSTEQCEAFFKGRRSVRAYKEKAVSQDKISRLIDIARYAPTARNSQGVRWLVVTDREEIKRYSGLVIDFFRVVLNEGVPGINPNPHLGKLISDYDAGVDVILRDAPTLIITYGDKENRLAQNDCVIALSNLELITSAMGLGGCWAGFFMTASANYEPLKEALSLPEKHQCFGALMIGYPRFRYQRIPIRKEPKIIWR